MMRSLGMRIAMCIVAVFALAAGQLTLTRAQAEQSAAPEPSAAEISQRIKLRSAIPGKAYSRADVIEELREEKRKIHEAGQAGVEILDAEVDAEYARMARRMNVTTAQMTENLAQEGVTPETVKHYLRAALAWQRSQKDRPRAQ